MNSKEYRFTKDWPYHVSGGGIIYRRDDNDIKVLVLVHHNGKYDIPKGTLHYGETLEQCALREMKEESGQKGEIVGYLGGRLDEGVDKNSNVAISKITHYFAIKWISDTATHDDEYERIEWMTIQEAQDALNKPSSTEVLNRFKQFIDIFSDQMKI